MKKYQAFLALIALLVNVYNSNCQVNNKNVVTQNQFDNIIEAQMGAYNISGLTATIINNDREVYHFNNGLANRETGLEVTDSTFFLLYSATKLFTGIGLMQLWEDDLFEIDDPINDYLPFEVIHPNYPDTDITFKMLLSHMSGIDDNWAGVINNLMVFNYDTPISLHDFCYEYFSEEGEYYDADINFISSEPGTSWDYTNAGVTLIGYLIEVISGQSYFEYIDEQILQPLEMNTSTFFLSELDTSFLANEYLWYNNDYYPVGFRSCPLLPAGFLHTKRTEMANFQQMLLNKGSFNGNTIIEDATLDLMMTRHYPNAAPNTGLIFAWDHVIEAWGHTGGINGFVKTAIFFKEDEDWSIGMMCNGAQDPYQIIFMLSQYADDYKAISEEFIEIVDNGDLILESNESFGLNIELRNNLLEDLSNIEAELSCINENITITENTDIIIEMPSGEVANESASFTINAGSFTSGFEQEFKLIFYQEEEVIDSTFFSLYFGEAEILLIKDEEHFYNLRANADSYYEASIENSNYSYRKYDINKFNFPSVDFLESFNAVIWYTGLDNPIYNELFTEEQQGLLAEYLDNGGNLFLSSQNIGDAIGDSDFFKNYLKANHLVPSYEGYLRIDGIDGTDIGDGLVCNLQGGDGANTQTSASVIEPINGGEAIFKYFASDDVAGIMFDKSYRMVFLPVSFEAISSQSNRDELMERILNFFLYDVGINDIAKDEMNIILYPNPSDGSSLRINHHYQNSEIKIYNMLSELVYEQKSIAEVQLNNQLKSGVYFVHINKDSEELIQKLIIKD